MKTKSTKKPEKTRAFILTRWRKLYVSAMDAHSADFAEAEPSGNLARIFVALLLVHVFLIASIIIYNIVAERPRIENAISVSQPGKPKNTPSVRTPKPANVVSEQAPSNAIQTYVVGSGDTTPSIAQKFGVDANELLTLNHLDDGGEIYPGKELKIPTKIQAKESAANVLPSVNMAAHIESQPPQAKPQAAPETAKFEDNVPKATLVQAPPLADVAVEPPSQADAKPIKSRVAEIEQKISAYKPVAKVPAKQAVTKQAIPLRSYTANSKDTFYSVARKYKIKVDDLMRLNGVSDPSKLHEGVKLKIPAASN